MADLGYLGIDKYHAASYVPHKKPKGKELTDEQEEENRELAGERVAVEHVIGRLKVFKILAEKYRNRRERFELRFNLIAGIFNFELELTDL